MGFYNNQGFLEVDKELGFIAACRRALIVIGIGLGGIL